MVRFVIPLNKSLGGFVAAFMLMLAAVQLPAVQNTLIDRAISHVGRGYHLTSQAKAHWGFFPFIIKLDKLSLSDNQGPLAQAQNIEVRLAMRRLLMGKASIKKLHIDGLTVYRKPGLIDTAGSITAGPSPMLLAPLILNQTALHSLRVEHLTLEKEVLGTFTKARLAFMPGAKGQTLTLTSKAENGQTSTIHLNLTHYKKGGRLVGTLEDKGGLVGQLMALSAPKLAGAFKMDVDLVLPNFHKPRKIGGHINYEGALGQVFINCKPIKKTPYFQLEAWHAQQGLKTFYVSSMLQVDFEPTPHVHFKEMHCTVGSQRFDGALTLSGQDDGLVIEGSVLNPWNALHPYLGVSWPFQFTVKPHGLHGSFRGVHDTRTLWESHLEGQGLALKGILQSTACPELGNWHFTINEGMPFQAHLEHAHLQGHIAIKDWEPPLASLEGHFHAQTMPIAAGHAHGLEINITSPHGRPTLAAQATQLLWGQIWQAPHLKVWWDKPALHWHIHTAHSRQDAPTLTCTGQLDVETHDLKFETFNAQDSQNHIHLTKPVHMDLTTRTLSPLSLQINKQEAQATNIHGHPSWGGKVTWNRIPLGALGLFMPYWRVQGTTDGTLTLSGDSTLPHVKLEGTVHEVTPSHLDHKHFGGFNGHIKLDHTPSETAWNITLQGADRSFMKSQGHASYVEGRPDGAQTLTGTLEGETPLSVFVPFLGNGDRLGGHASLKMTLAGTTQEPDITGFINVANGLYEHGEEGTYIENIQGRLTLKNKRLIIDELTGTDSKKDNKGRVNGHGFVDISHLTAPVFNIKLDLTTLDIANSDYFNGQATGQLTIEGTYPNFYVGGDVTLDKAALYLDELNGPKAEPVEVVGFQRKIEPSAQPRDVLPLNFILRAPQNFMIYGMGFDSEWQGQMHVKGALPDPHLEGEISVIRGRLDVYAKSMDLQNSTIRFDMEEPDIPYLSIRAAKPVDGIEIYLVIEGRATKPRFTFTSSPSLTEEEVLARLLFGREASRISVGQSIQLASALSRINGSKKKDFFTQFRTSFGLDTVELKEVRNEDTGTAQQALSVGKEFGKVKLSIDQGTGTESSKVLAEVNVAPNLNLNMDVGGNRSSGVGLDWVRRY